jgi:hypothetical protein
VIEKPEIEEAEAEAEQSPSHEPPSTDANGQKSD